MTEDFILLLIAVVSFLGVFFIIGVVHGAQYASMTIAEAKREEWDWDAVRVKWCVPNNALHRAEAVIFKATHDLIIAVAKVATLPWR